MGLKVSAKTRTTTSVEFERKAAEGSTVGVFANALQEALDPVAGKAKEVQMQMKDGRHQKNEREGKGNGDAK